MFGLGFGELIVVFIIVMIFIGPKKLPELAKGLGQGIREFQKATKGFTQEVEQVKDEVRREIAGSIETPKTETQKNEDKPENPA